MYGTDCTPDQCEALRDNATPTAVGGDADWRVAAYAYAVHVPIVVDGVTVPMGAYLRLVSGGHVEAQRFPLADLALAVEYATRVESAYRSYLDAA